ncbi:MAG: helix-turn-helix transcriptional regulator [Clostridia bacterium]|nr:helix-turn-helix transcriptional regulator [Clostridia bacterium]
MSLGKNIRNLAFDKKITQKDLAKAAGISEALVAMHVHGKKIPSLRVMLAYAKKLGCTLDDLVKE